MNEQDEQALKQWLCEQLPDKLNIISALNYPHKIKYHWNSYNTFPKVTDREWPYIVSLVEAKLTEHEWRKYIWNRMDYTSFHGASIEELNTDYLKELLSRPWQTCAAALKQTLENTIS